MMVEDRGEPSTPRGRIKPLLPEAAIAVRVLVERRDPEPIVTKRTDAEVHGELDVHRPIPVIG